MKNEPDFYIGWQDKASPLFAKPVRRVVIGLFVLIPVVAVLLVWQQRGFSNAVFEYGTQTILEGQLIRQPVPFLRIPVLARTGAAATYERVLLIGLGKHGAEATLRQWEQKWGLLTGKTLKINGTLIHYEGQAALELTDQADALLAVSTPKTAIAPPVSVPMGTVSVTGEITDPKCFLGVMKPGDGRPHRSCAVRCIAGGIPPLLYTTGPHTGTGYLLAGANGEPVNAQMLAYVGKNVQVRGRLERADNWLILYVDAPVLVGQRLPDGDRQLAMCH